MHEIWIYFSSEKVPNYILKLYNRFFLKYNNVQVVKHLLENSFI